MIGLGVYPTQINYDTSSVISATISTSTLTKITGLSATIEATGGLIVAQFISDNSVTTSLTLSSSSPSPPGPFVSIRFKVNTTYIGYVKLGGYIIGGTSHTFYLPATALVGYYIPSGSGSVTVDTYWAVDSSGPTASLTAKLLVYEIPFIKT